MPNRKQNLAEDGEPSIDFQELLAEEGYSTTPFGPLGYCVGVIGFGFLCAFVAMPFMAQMSHGERVAAYIMDPLVLPFQIAWTLYGVHLGSVRRIVRPGIIEERSLIRSTTFEIASAKWLHVIKYGDKQQFERVDLGFDRDRKIVFGKYNSRYAELRDYLEETVSPKAIERGSTVVAPPDFFPGIKVEWLMTATILYITPFFVCMAYGDRIDAQDSLARIRALDAHASRTQGSVIAVDAEGCVDYRYVLDSRRYRKVSCLPDGKRAAIRVGSEVTVEYLPDSPGTSRISGSDGHERAADAIKSASQKALIGIIVPPLFALYSWRSMAARKRRARITVTKSNSR